jgi:hypothetical protein
MQAYRSHQKLTQLHSRPHPDPLLDQLVNNPSEDRLTQPNLNKDGIICAPILENTFIPKCITRFDHGTNRHSITQIPRHGKYCIDLSMGIIQLGTRSNCGHAPQFNDP